MWEKITTYYWSLHTAKNKIKSHCLDLNMKILRVYDWIIIAVMVAFHSNHGHIPGWQYQDSLGSNCERMVGREHKEYFSHEFVPLNPDLKFIESLWDVLEETLLDSCIVNTRSWPKMYALLMEINVVMLFQVVHTFLVYQFIYAQIQSITRIK